MARRTGLGRKPSRICGRLGVAVALWGALCLVLPLAAGLVPRGGALQADDVGVESGVNRGVQGRTAAPTWATDGSEPSESVLRGEGHFTEHVNAPEGAPLYFARSRGLLAGFLESQVIVDLREPEEAGPGGSGTAGEETERHVIARLTFPGSNPVPPRASDELPFSTSFFVGQDSKEWRTGLRSFSGLVYEDLYDNIDLVYTFEDHLKYEFLVSPGGDPRVIELSYEGVETVLADGNEVIIRTPIGEIRDSAPVAWQGEDPVDCSFVLKGAMSYGFACRGWDRSQRLVIDPIVYSSFLGGGAEDNSWDTVVDAAGNAFIVGMTESPDFPTTVGAYDVAHGGGRDAYLVKLSQEGTVLEWATFLGGSARDEAWSVAVDGLGNVYVSGFTESGDFPTTLGALDRTLGGSRDIFAAKVAPGGNVLLFATYIGGSDDAFGVGEIGGYVALPSSGGVYVSGRACSTDFPTTVDGFDTSFNGVCDVFVMGLDANTGTLQYSTFLGGADYDHVGAILLDDAGLLFVVGHTVSTDFPTTPGSYDTTFNGVEDGFVAKLNRTAGMLVYSTYVGGAAGDYPDSAALDQGGTVHVTGNTDSGDFPTTAGAFDGTYNGGVRDAMVFRLSADGRTLLYSTFLGGSGSGSGDYGSDIALDSAGDAYIVGETESPDFPITPDAFDPAYTGPNGDAYLAKISASGGALLYSTFLGGTVGENGAAAVALTPAGHILIAGWTDSPDFPTTADASDPSFNGVRDVFVAKFSLAFQVVVDSDPAGLQVSIDGTSYTTPRTFSCMGGTSATLGVTSPQNAGSTRYTFEAWSDGGGPSHGLPCDGPKTVVASFVTEFELTVDTIPSGRLVMIDGAVRTAPASAWCPSGSSVTLDAPSPQNSTGLRHVFASWSDIGAKSHPVACEGPAAYLVTFGVEFETVFESVPSGLQILVDGTAVTTPVTVWWASESNHSVEAPSPQRKGPVTYRFLSWSDGQVQRHTLAAEGSASYTARFEEDPGFPLWAWLSLLAAIPVLAFVIGMLLGRRRRQPQEEVAIPLPTATATVEPTATKAGVGLPPDVKLRLLEERLAKGEISESLYRELRQSYEAEAGEGR